MTAAPSSAKQPTKPDKHVVVDRGTNPADEPATATASGPPAAYSVPQATPNDPYFPIQWGLSKADVIPAWDRTLGTANILVANLDTGYDFTGPELKPAAAGPGRDFVGENADSPTEDGNATDTDLLSGGHGLHTAGIIAAQRDNKVGLAGIAPGVKILPVRVCGRSPSLKASICPEESQVDGVHYAAAQGARIVNLPLSATMALDDLRDAIDNYPQILFVVAAGNAATSTPSYPCAYDLANVLCVAASDQADNRAPFSNYGPVVDLAAPGTSIVSTYRGQLKPVNDTFQQNNFVANWAGNGWARAAAGDGPLTTYGMNDSPGVNPAPNTTAQVTWRPDASVPANAGRCRVEGRRYVSLGTDDVFLYRVMNGSEVISTFRPGNTAGSGLQAFVSDEFDGAGKQVSLRVRYEAKATPGAGVWLDDLAVVCVAPANYAAGYAYYSGTSMAASHVSGVAALMLSLSPASSADVVRSTILTTVRTLPGWSGVVASGGVVDAGAALGRLVPPDTIITAGPPPTTPNRATFFFQRESPAAATFMCRLDASAFRPCTSGKLRKGISVGTHVFSVYAVDSWGNLDATPATYAWTVVRCKVPKLKGLKGSKLAKAEKRLNASGCLLGKVIRPKGVPLKKTRIKETLPKRGTKLRSGAKVTLVLVRTRR